VKDGGGITPDVVINPEAMSQISAELYLRNFIFDFATRYYWSHQAPENPSQFSLTGQDYSDFAGFLKERNFSYKTITETSFNELIASAKKEKYYELHKDLFGELEKDIAHDLDQDLIFFRDEITRLLEEEIIGRYFYEEGAIAWSVKKDEQITKALEILNDNGKYDSILEGKSVPVLRANAPPASSCLYPSPLLTEHPGLLHSTFHI
jgi:carboxyl-terminal processing protease